MSLSFLDIQDAPSDINFLERFYGVTYVQGFPDPDERESLENMQQYLALRSAGWYGANNYHIILALEDDDIVGGAVCDFLSEPNVGVIEFLLVAESHRGRGIGRSLHDTAERILQDDSRRTNPAGLTGIVMEMNDPFRVDPRTDSMDPFQRATMWGNWGYCALQFEYVQPALSADQSPVLYLLLCLKPMQVWARDSVPSDLAERIVSNYLRWAMRINDPVADATFQTMSKSLERMRRVPLLSLNRYVGHDPQLPFDVIPIPSSLDPQFGPLMSFYSESFADDRTAIADRAFVLTMQRIGSGKPGLHYHLWGVRPVGEGVLCGIASFFTLSRVGFGGYIALEPPLRATGRCRLLLARIEACMTRDQPGIRGWYIECEPDSVAAGVFEHLGFTRVARRYLQPSLHAFDEHRPVDSCGPELALMYKPLSQGFAPDPNRGGEIYLAEDVDEILRKVYSIDEPRQSRTFRLLLNSSFQ